MLILRGEQGVLVNVNQVCVCLHTVQPSRRISMGGFFYAVRMLKQSASMKKVEVQAKVEKKRD